MINSLNIIGLGALGMMFGGIAAENGEENSVNFVMDEERLRRHSKDKYTVNGEERAFPMISSDDAKPSDLLLLGVKYPQLESALDLMEKCIDSHTVIMSMMNGVTSEEKIHERFPENKIIYTVPQGMDAMRFGTDLIYTKTGSLYIGNPKGDEDPEDEKALSDVKDYFDRIKMPYVMDPDIMYRMWFKYMLNVGTNQTCMVYKIGYGKLTEPGSAAYVLFIGAMREVKEIALKRGITLTEEDIDEVVEIEKTLDPEATPSMGQDRIAKRPSEVDMFAGVVIELGKKYGIRTPANEYLYRRVKEIEAEY